MNARWPLVALLLLGEAVAGPLADSRLTPVDHVDTFWFAWAAFHPTTRIVGTP